MATQAYQQLGQGLGTAIGNFFGGGSNQARMAGEMAGLQAAELEQRIAGNQVQQRLNQQKLDEAERQRLLTAPEAALTRVAQLFGVPTDNVGDLQSWQRTGRLPERLMTPGHTLEPGLQGPVTPATPPSWGTPENLTKIAQTFFADQSAQAGSAKTLKDAFEALVLQPKATLTSGIADGSVSPQVGGQRFAAIEGKPLVSAHEYGVVDNFTGQVDASSPVATRYGQWRDAATGAQKANAVQSYAAADNSRASATKTRQEMTEGGGAYKLPANYRWKVGGQPGEVEPIPGGPADPDTKGAKQTKPPTEGQAKALLFGSRMAIADEVLSELEQSGNRLPNLGKQAAETVPLIGGALGMGANLFTSDGEQQVEQAQRDFINAVLRRESGAVIADSEFNNARRQYFAQPGDSPATLRQKAANRRTAIAGMKAEFGDQSAPDFDRIVGEARATRQGSASASPAGAKQPVRVTNDAEYNALPPGTRFVTPDGRTGTKR
jgi:hypothetical protein